MKQQPTPGPDAGVNGTEQPATPDGTNRRVSPAEQVAQRAYERFQMRGGTHGHDQEDWFEAERELKASR